MADKTEIEWTDATWNPIRGCSRVSEGCRNCYAEKVASRFSGAGLPYEGLTTAGKWNGAIKFAEERLLDPLRWKAPRRIFVNSMSDLFHPNVTDEMLDRIFAVMGVCPQHTFQVLTKRPERMLAYLSAGEYANGVIKVARNRIARHALLLQHLSPSCIDPRSSGSWPLPNVWLGVSVEDQKTADERIPLLLQTPAAVRFLSVEPMLGAVDLVNINAMVWFREYMAKINPHEAMRQANSEFYPKHCPMDALTGECVAVEPELQECIDWVICGGESGPGARPMHPDWARSLRDQCVAAGVPFFFKQWGEWAPRKVFGVCGPDDAGKMLPFTTVCSSDRKNIGKVSHDAYPAVLGSRNVWEYDRMDRVGKKAAGDLLDGVQWHQFPGKGLSS